jgi:hypothetical protein
MATGNIRLLAKAFCSAPPPPPPITNSASSSSLKAAAARSRFSLSRLACFSLSLAAALAERELNTLKPTALSREWVVGLMPCAVVRDGVGPTADGAQSKAVERAEEGVRVIGSEVSRAVGVAEAEAEVGVDGVKPMAVGVGSAERGVSLTPLPLTAADGAAGAKTEAAEAEAEVEVEVEAEG